MYGVIPNLTATQPRPSMALLKTWPKSFLKLLVFAVILSGAPGNIWIQPLHPVITPSGNVQVNCSTNCTQPERIGLETQLNKIQVDNGTGWIVFLLRNVTQDNQLHCFANCIGEAQMLSSTNITVIQPPEHVKLDPLPPWILVGQNFTFRCQVWGGKPRQNLTMVLLRGSQELSRQTVSEQDLGKAAEVTLTVTARREDHGVNFSCRAEMDLRAQGLELYQNSSDPVELHTFALGSPQLMAPKLLEVGKEETVSCEVDKLFPVENAQIHLYLGGRSLNPTVIRNQHTLRATAIATVAKGEREGQWELTCNVTLGGQNREVQKNLTIYSFPPPNLVISEASVPEGTLVNVTCVARAGARVRINGTRWSSGEIAQLSLNATEEYDGAWITCQAVLELLGETLWRNKSLQLLVQYGPRLDEAGCPGRWTWREGTMQVLQCRARGNPVPTVTCIRDNDQGSLSVGVPVPVTRAHGGAYRCSARSRRGQAATWVTVTVEESPRDSVPIVMGLLVAVGVVVLVATIATVLLRGNLHKGSYYPQMLPLQNRGAHVAAPWYVRLPRGAGPRGGVLTASAGHFHHVCPPIIGGQTPIREQSSPVSGQGAGEGGSQPMGRQRSGGRWDLP
ncbi:intercellular adhesion molecule 3 [Macrotis lagotis]|uniref:intercellular adhesion molecule 3 n=1 Tax=Macrotis lagotis TaxID=92651 RepID=UPI003D68574E